MKFTIYGRLPSLNEYTKDNRSNKYQGARTKKQAEKTIIQAIQCTKTQKIYKYPCELKIAWYEQNLRRDIDNIVFATKFIQDALVKAGVLVNDSQKYINKLTHEVLVDRNNPRIEVEIIERSGDNDTYTNH